MTDAQKNEINRNFDRCFHAIRTGDWYGASRYYHLCSRMWRMYTTPESPEGTQGALILARAISQYVAVFPKKRSPGENDDL